MDIRPTETIAREVIDGQMDEILGYINPANDNMLAAWEMARDRAQRMVRTLNEVCRTIAARPLVNGNTAMRQVSAEQFTEEDFSLNPEQEAAFEKLAQETAQIREVAQAESLKPEVFDIVGWTQNYFKEKGA